MSVFIEFAKSEKPGCVQVSYKHDSSLHPLTDAIRRNAISSTWSGKDGGLFTADITRDKLEQAVDACGIQVIPDNISFKTRLDAHFSPYALNPASR